MAGVDDQDGWGAVLARAHAAWPAAWVPDDEFAAYVRARISAQRDPATALREIAIADLYLACACARGVEAAAEAFARTFLGEVPAHVAGLGGSADFASDVSQAVAAKLLVAAPGEQPSIADYAGSAPLSAWVRVVAIRTGLNLRRGKAAELERADERALAAHVAATDVEVEVIRRRYGPALEEAVARALASLTTRERTLLRLRLAEGMEVDAIATMYGMHRTTATRWLAACRDKLAAETRRVLSEGLGLTSAELESVARVIQSQLHVSVARLLRDG